MHSILLVAFSLLSILACSNRKAETASFDPTNKEIVIVGDSYSTFDECIPSGYSSYYGQHSSKIAGMDVERSSQTWWSLLSREWHAPILKNISYSGSTICSTGYGGADFTSISFVTRCRNYLGEGRNVYMADQPLPEVIIIFGGTNDCWAGAPVGEPKYSDWTDKDMYSCLPAFCFLIDYLKTWNPDAKIINLVNMNDVPGQAGIHDDNIINGMREICKHYQIDNIELTNVKKIDNHPNAEGMISIKDQIVNFYSKKK